MKTITSISFLLLILLSACKKQVKESPHNSRIITEDLESLHAQRVLSNYKRDVLSFHKSQTNLKQLDKSKLLSQPYFELLFI